MASTYTPIATQTLGSATSTVTFSSIPATYTDLVLVVSAKCNTGGSVGLISNFNSDLGANYSFTYLNGNGSSASSGRVSGTTLMAFCDLPASGSSAGVMTAQIMNYANTTTYKTVITRGNDASAVTQSLVNLWRSTAAINRIDLAPNSGVQFAAGGTFTLYGIKAA